MVSIVVKKQVTAVLSHYCIQQVFPFFQFLKLHFYHNEDKSISSVNISAILVVVWNCLLSTDPWLKRATIGNISTKLLDLQLGIVSEKLQPA